MLTFEYIYKYAGILDLNLLAYYFQSSSIYLKQRKAVDPCFQAMQDCARWLKEIKNVLTN